jgi:hypothetical protein
VGLSEKVVGEILNFLKSYLVNLVKFYKYISFRRVDFNSNKLIVEEIRDTEEPITDCQ